MPKGRPPKDGADGLKRFQVLLDEETIRVMRLRGGGNLSLGIRISTKLIKALSKARGL